MEKLIELAIKYDREKEGTSFDWNITNGDYVMNYVSSLYVKIIRFIKYLFRFYLWRDGHNR